MTKVSIEDAMELNRGLVKPYKSIAILFFVMYLLQTCVFGYFIYKVYDDSFTVTQALEAEDTKKLNNNSEVRKWHSTSNQH